MKKKLNRTTMKRLIGYAALGLTICALARPTALSAKDLVERPFKFRNDFTTVNYTPFPSVAVLEGTGWATHLGSLTAKGGLGGLCRVG